MTQKQMQKLENGDKKTQPSMLTQNNDLEDDKFDATINKNGKSVTANKFGGANGWTVAKVQRLYMKYCRAESFRKALAYQKRYLTILAYDDKRHVKKANGKPKTSLKVVSCAVIAI